MLTKPESQLIQTVLTEYHSAGTNHLAVPPIKLTIVANQLGFSGCRPTNLEQPAGWRDICHHYPASTSD